MDSIAPVKNISILESVSSAAQMNIKKIPGGAFARVVAFFRAVYAESFGEAIVLLFYDEVKKLYKMELDPPHVHDAWTHTLQVVNYCQQLMAISENYPDPKRLHPRIKQAMNTLGKYKEHIFKYLNDPISLYI